MLREQLARTDDLAVLGPQLDAVRARINAAAGPHQTLLKTRPPDRIVRLLGPLPSDDRRRQWLDLAERLEAHRERWGLPAAPRGLTGRDRARRMWESNALERDLERWARQRRSIERGLGRDLGSGLGR